MMIESEGSLRKEDQHFGPWLKAAPFMASRKSFLAIPGFFANKKAVKSSQTQAGIQTQPQKPPLGEAWEIPSKLQSKITEKAVNHASDSPSEVTPSTPVLSMAPILVPPIQTNKAFVFEELIADFDRDIHCFDRMVPTKNISNGNQEKRTSSLQNGPHIPNTSHSSPHPMEPIHLSLLKDITKNSSSHHQLNWDNDKKWVCIQRTNFCPNDELLETSLGKRGASSSLENSQPLKRLATNEDVLPNRPTQTVVAGRQPRRSR